MIVKTITDLLSRTEINEEQELCVTDGEYEDKVGDIYQDEDDGKLVFYTGEWNDDWKPYFIKDLKQIINSLQLDLDTEVVVDCNEFVSINRIYICNNTKKLMIILN